MTRLPLVGQSETVTISREVAERIDRAFHEVEVHMVAFANTTPYPDDPRWSPWTRFQKPVAERCDAARKELRKAMAERAPEVQAA